MSHHFTSKNLTVTVKVPQFRKESPHVHTEQENRAPLSLDSPRQAGKRKEEKGCRGFWEPVYRRIRNIDLCAASPSDRRWTVTWGKFTVTSRRSNIRNCQSRRGICQRQLHGWPVNIRKHSVLFGYLKGMILHWIPVLVVDKWTRGTWNREKGPHCSKGEISIELLQLLFEKAKINTLLVLGKCDRVALSKDAFVRF